MQGNADNSYMLLEAYKVMSKTTVTINKSHMHQCSLCGENIDSNRLNGFDQALKAKDPNP